MVAPACRRRLVSVVASLATLASLVGCSAGNDDDGAAPTTPPESTDAPPVAAPAAPAALPVPRTEVAGVAWQGRLLVTGGLTADGGASDLAHLWDPTTNAWSAAPRLPSPLHHAAMAVVADRAVVVGGYTNGPGQPWVAQDTMFSLGAGEDGWRRDAPLPAPRGAAAAASAAGLLVVAGGESGGQALAATSVYDPATGVWRAGPELAQAREHLAAAATDGRVYAIAGRTTAGQNFTVVESLDPVADRAWRAEPALNDSRGGIGADLLGDRVCVAGGEEAAGTIVSVECLDDSGWKRVGALARPRHGLAVMALGDELHVVAGGEQPGLFVSGAHEALPLRG